MARYLRSTTTGAVLPYNEKLLRRTNVELLTPSEAADYEASVSKVPAPKKKKAKKAKAASKPKAEAKEAPVVVADIADGEPDADAVLAALELD